MAMTVGQFDKELSKREALEGNVSSEISLTIGQCQKKDCGREALDGYNRCAYHRAVQERSKYENLKDAGKLGALGIAVTTIGKKAWDIYRTFS